MAEAKVGPVGIQCDSYRGMTWIITGSPYKKDVDTTAKLEETVHKLITSKKDIQRRQ